MSKILLQLLVPFVLAPLLAGCTSTAPDAVDLSQRVVFDSATDTTGGFAGPLASDHSTIVVRSEAEWQALWYGIHNNGTGDPVNVALPPVDFSREMLVGIGVGRRTNGCYAARITDVADVEGQRVVVAKEVSSDGCPGLICTGSASVSPVLIVAVGRTDLPVYFQWRAETTCP